MAVKVKKFVIQAKVNEAAQDTVQSNIQPVDTAMLKFQKQEILEECKEMIEDILEKKASRI